jgi:hypothetical protein
MHEDAKKVMAERYPRRAPAEVPRLSDRVLQYLDHRMVIAICNVMSMFFIYIIQ